MTADRSPGITGVGTVRVPVKDQARAVAFYTEKLGFEVRLDLPYLEDQRWIELAPPGARTTISIVIPGGPDPVQPGGYVQFILATGDAEATRVELDTLGVELEPIFEPPGGAGGPMFFLQDADGNHLLVVERE